jgi:5-methylcytosine-specific restriction protein A
VPKAPRYCPVPNCFTLIKHTPRCREHTQAWPGERTASSKVTSQRAWKVFAEKVKRRDGYQCQIRYEGICKGHADTVDKIIPAARRPDLAMDPQNCRSACNPCNQHKARTTDRRR